MTPDELASRLAPVRLPAEFARLDWPEMLAALSLGLLLGLAVAALLRLLTERRLDAPERARREIERLARLDGERRLLGLARLLARLDPAGPRPEGLDRALYREGAADLAALERAILRAARRRG
ncbi:MAG: hypothetical protein ACFBWO_17950 [Paracoccaceae bacterium]